MFEAAHYFNILKDFPLTDALINPAPGNRIEHCSVAYANRFYVYSGNGDDQVQSWFSYVEAPFNTQNPKWVAMPVEGAHNVSRAACVVTSSGIFLVIGGGYSEDQDYTGVSAFDLAKGTDGTWYKPKTTGMDTTKFLKYRDSHRAISGITSFKEEFVFVFGGYKSNDTYILRVANMTWETIPIMSNSPPQNGLFGIAYSKDNVYIVGGTSDFNGGLFNQIWGFNVPTRKWFDPQSTMPTAWFDAHIGKLNDTFFMVSSDASSMSSMRIWTLSNNSFWTDRGSMSTRGHEYYSHAQLPGSDALITYGGNGKKNSTNSTESDAPTSDLLVFNMTKRLWVTECNIVTNAPMDQYVGGPLATNQEDPFLKKTTTPNGNDVPGNDSTSSNTSSSSSKTRNIFIGGGVVAAISFALGVYLAIRNRIRKKIKHITVEPKDYQDLEISHPDYMTGTPYKSVKFNAFPEQQKPESRPITPKFPNYPQSANASSSSIRKPESKPITPKPPIYPQSVNSSSSSVRLLNPTTENNSHEMRVRPNFDTSCKFKDEVFGRHKLTAMIYDQPDASSIGPSAPTGTVILHRYRLGGNSVNGGNNTVRQAHDEQTDDQVAMKFFQSYESFEREVVMLKYLRSRHVGELLALYELPSKEDWPYLGVLNYYPQSLDKLILTKLSTMDSLYIKLVIKSLTQAIHYLHTHNVVHLDIKPANFVHESGDITSWRLIDFEAARIIGEEPVDDCSPLYCSPEVLNGAQTQSLVIASSEMDMWSLGCIIFELYTHTPLFYSQDEAFEKLSQIYHAGQFVDPPFNKIPDLQARNMLEKLLSAKPSERISCEQVLRSAFLNSGLDTRQLSSLQSESTNRIITAVNQNTTTILSTLQETTNLILSQIDAVINSVTDTMDAAIPRLYILLPGNESKSLFKPQNWGKNTFILHLLCEGLDPENREAHFTSHNGYSIHDPKPLLAKTGPYLSILAKLMGAGVGHFTHLRLPVNFGEILGQMSIRPTEYFKQLTTVLDIATNDPQQLKDIEIIKNDPIGRMKVVQGPALRELEAFLEKNDQARELGGLERIVLNNGRWRWVCEDCQKKVHERLNNENAHDHQINHQVVETYYMSDEDYSSGMAM
ncbi:hypothetical protein G9A89_000991 [Geosiphon pyriformis]|nr:hypothetical protein G9A89_000991 [Geosiphon pyriformis]